jgi:hypothetical protein
MTASDQEAARMFQDEDQDFFEELDADSEGGLLIEFLRS